MVNYIGEDLWIGYVARLLIVAGFVSALFGAVAYGIAVQRRDSVALATSWRSIGNIGLSIHSFGILGLIGLIFYSMVTEQYEYNYVFEHVNEELPMKYILSAFWEGQEGSFMLWMFWHIILAWIVWKSDKQWSSPVLAVILMVEVWLTSMILGIYMPWGDDVKLGSNPMVLIREATQAPIFSNANYLSLIKGRGLNPLLQNYWNVIHPPTLFLGFASTLLPFAYAIAGLWMKDDKAWMRIGLKWALFSGGILGVGILMGSLWAYEALSFSGYWAWDPVENTSLVPWIILIAGIHTNMIANNTGHGIRATYLFYILTFVLVIYSTTLTRSGILGDTSAHAFTEMGLEWQLLGFLLFFLLGGLAWYAYRYKTIPAPQKEESINSREFWMFIGSLVLIFSGTLITASSSLPVYNTIVKLWDPSYVGGVLKDPVAHYNKYQLWIGVFASLLMAVSVFLQYRKEVYKKETGIRIAIQIAIAVALTVGFGYLYQLPAWHYQLLAFSGLFVIVSNAHYIWSIAKLNGKLLGSPLSHIGFGMMLLGILTSGLNSYHLNNPFLMEGAGADKEFAEKYVQLIKGKPLLVRGHFVTYNSDTLIGRDRFYDLKFVKVDKDLKPLDSFNLRPTGLYSNDFSKVASFNPDTKHYLHKDIFSCVMNIPPHLSDSEKLREMEDSLKYTQYNAALGDTIKVDGYGIVIKNVGLNPTHPEFDKTKKSFGVEYAYELFDDRGDQLDKGVTAIALDGSLVYSYPAKIDEEGMRIKPSENVFDKFLTYEDALSYTEHTLKQGETFSSAGYKFTLTGFDKNGTNANYEPEKGDIAVTALLDVSKDGTSEVYQSKPLYVIRGTSPMSIKDYNPDQGLHIRLSNINPKEEAFTFRVAKDVRNNNLMPIDVALNVPRSDYIILQAKVFPAINLFWLGCMLMMTGLFMAWGSKFGKKKVA